jgi:serine phosphatase RsbU (regulator of sigma subunit)
LVRDTQYEVTTHPLNPQDRLLLFTDGLYEVERSDGQQYGLDRLEEALRRRIHVGGLQLLDELLLDTRCFSTTGEFTDDVCLVSIELLPQNGTVQPATSEGHRDPTRLSGIGA